MTQPPSVLISDRSDNPATPQLEGFTTTFTYDAVGNKLTETDPLGNLTRYTYGTNNRLLSETDPLGRTTLYKYDSKGNLIGTTDANQKTTIYEYEATGLLKAVTDAVTTAGQKNMQFKYDPAGNVSEVTDAAGNVTTYTYDSNGNRKTETRKGIALKDGGVKQDLTTTWTYDKNNRIKTVTDATGSLTAYGYDANGQQTWMLDPRGYFTEYQYTLKGELEFVIESDGTRYQYVPATGLYTPASGVTPGNPALRKRTQYVYDNAGRKIKEIDQMGRVTEYRYDDTGRLEFTLAPDATPADSTDNPKTQTVYSTDGTVKAQIDERGNRTEYRYDNAGRLTETIYPDTTPTDLSNNPRTRVTYDGAGQQRTVTNARNYTTSYAYDALGRLTTTRLADQSTITTEYDALGRRTATIDQMGYRTEYRYDALSRLTGVKNANGDWTEYSYNQVGNLLWLEDANDHRTYYEYDSLGRRTAEVLPLLQRAEMTYDSNGNLKTHKDFNGKTITYTYDPLNRLSQEQFSDNSKVTYTYTPTGQRDLVSFFSSTNTLTARYDYNYDERDRLVRLTNPDGRIIDYTYDAASNRTSLITPSSTITYTYDERNRLDLVKQGTTTLADYGYDANNNLITTSFADGTTETRRYDERDQLIHVDTKKTPSTTLFSADYTLDKVGNRVIVQELIGTTPRSSLYTYDNLYRLTQELTATPSFNTSQSLQILYRYDKVGNRLSKEDKYQLTTTLYVYDNNDRLTTETTGNQQTTYIYDNNGNTKTRTVKVGTTTIESATYTWDDENQLTAATITKGSTTDQMSYRYDADGIRVVATVNSSETRFLIDPNQPYAQVLEEYTPAGVVQVAYVYGHDLISQKQGTSTTYYHTDGLGSTRVVTDASGTVLNTYSYKAFGEGFDSTETTANKYRFAGEQFDEKLGDYYLRARFYDPESGRFTRRDDYEGSLSNPLSLHRYSYTHNNPINSVDPSGYITLLENAQVYLFVLASAVLYYSVPIISSGIDGGRDLSDEEALKIEESILAYANTLIPYGSDPRNGKPLCDAFTFAGLMQYAAGQIQPRRWVNDKATRLDFLKIGIDMFTGENSFRSLGKLGERGPASRRPWWLKTHNDDARLWKRFAYPDTGEEVNNGTSYYERPGDGRRDHFLVNAILGHGIGGGGDVIRQDPSENDVMYNIIGSDFGYDLVIRGSVSQAGVSSWILTRTAP